MSAQVRAAALANFGEVARQVGLNVGSAMRAAGVDLRALTDPDMRIPTVAVVELLEAAAKRSGCETFGLRMAESRQLSDFGALSLLMTHQPTLRAVMSTIGRYRYLLNESLLTHIEDAGDLVVVREELVADTKGSLRQSYELAVGTLFRMFRALLGSRWQPFSVNFVHAAPSDLRVHRRVFGTNVEFGSEFNGFVCAATDLDRVNPSADPVLATYALQFVETLPNSERESTTHEVRKAAYILLPLGSLSIERVARSIGLNVRTLQRRLAVEGAEFSSLVDGVRRDLALRYMENPNYSVTRISELLGYGQLSSFTRWFSAAFGVPPASWRDNHQPKNLHESRRPKR